MPPPEEPDSQEPASPLLSSEPVVEAALSAEEPERAVAKIIPPPDLPDANHPEQVAVPAEPQLSPEADSLE